MAYSTHIAPAPFGASLRNIAKTTGKSVLAVLKTLHQAMITHSTANQRLQQVERLEAKTDAELAALGIKRAEIVHRVFGTLC